jgi:hypothetical protein
MRGCPFFESAHFFSMARGLNCSNLAAAYWEKIDRYEREQNQQQDEAQPLEEEVLEVDNVRPDLNQAIAEALEFHSEKTPSADCPFTRDCGGGFL